VTARAALYGFLLSAVLGAPSAIAFSASRVLARALYPYAILPR
jgi:ABC-type nitrate/sulfonate/bicarbonate transport system permease component